MGADVWLLCSWGAASHSIYRRRYGTRDSNLCSLRLPWRIYLVADVYHCRLLSRRAVGPALRSRSLQRLGGSTDWFGRAGRLHRLQEAPQKRHVGWCLTARFPGVNEERAVKHRAYSPFGTLRAICFALTDVMC